jgi:arylsulfatase A-like enzyme
LSDIAEVSKKQTAGTREVLGLAIWFGLAGGLLQGILAWTFQQAGWVAWKELLASVDLNVLWVSPAVNALLFFSLGVILLPVLRFLSQWQVIATGIFATLTFYGCLSVPGRLRERGAVMLALGCGVVVSRWMGRDVKRGMLFLRQTLAPLAVVCLFAMLSVVGGTAAWEKWQISQLPEPPANAPNVLLIVLDTLRAERLSSYGYPRPTTPFLDAYAQRGVLFEKAFSTSSWTLPAHTSMFTGRLPIEHGAGLWRYDGRYPTLAEALSRRGYATAAFVANEKICTAAFGLARGFQRWENIFWDAKSSFVATTFGKKLKQFYVPWFNPASKFDRMDAPEVNRRFLRWLDHRPNRPFFAFLNFMEVHSPVNPPRSFAERFSKHPDEISSSRWFRKRASLPELSARGRENKNDAYDASLAYLDTQLKALFQELERRGLEQDLLVVIVSDHGESLGENGLFDHRSALYLPQIRVPLILRFPGRIPEGRRVSAVVGIQDLTASIAELIALKNPSFGGTSLVACWTSPDSNAGERFSSAELDHSPFSTLENWPSYHGAIKSLIGPRWHYIVHEKLGKALFDWQTDPQEARDVATTVEGQKIAADYAARLQTILTHTANGAPLRSSTRAVE